MIWQTQKYDMKKKSIILVRYDYNNAIIPPEKR